MINDDIVKRCSTILIYVSFKDEVDTLKLIKFFLQNKRVAVPKIENNNMNFYYIKSTLIEHFNLLIENKGKITASLEINKFIKPSESNIP